MAEPVLNTVEPQRSPLAEFSSEELYRELIVRFGEDPTREGLLRTPERVQKAMEFLTKGYQQDAGEIFRGAMFDVDYDEMVIVKDVEVFSSMRASHAAVLRSGARRLYSQRQSDRVEQGCPAGGGVCAPPAGAGAADAADCRHHSEAIEPQGVGVVIEARHLCMMMRGVEKQHSSTVTSAMLGAFRSNQQTRQEFLSLVHGRGENGI